MVPKSILLTMADILLEIVEKVKKGGWDPYRPQLPSQLIDMPELVGIMTQCWAEVPQDRPSFDDLVKQFKQFNSGRSASRVVDPLFNILYISDYIEVNGHARKSARLAIS